MTATKAASALFLSVLLLAGCGSAPATPRAQQDASPQDLPAVRDLDDIQIPIDPGPGTPAPAEPREYDVDAHPASWSHGNYYGYRGPWFSQLQWDRGITVIEPSVFEISDDEMWAANLLVRNDSLVNVGAAVVTADLLDSAGKVLGQASGVSPVSDARPGEPVPVHLQSDVAASQVQSVVYRADAPAKAPAVRKLDTVTLRTFPYGDREPITLESIAEPQGEGVPRPFTLLTQVTNESDLPVSDFQVVFAWMNDKDQIVHISDDAQPVDYGQTLEQKQFGQDHVLEVSDPEIARSLNDLYQLTWVVAK